MKLNFLEKLEQWDRTTKGHNKSSNNNGMVVYLLYIFNWNWYLMRSSCVKCLSHSTNQI